jgi:biopolymer transport protein ExbD
MADSIEHLVEPEADDEVRFRRPVEDAEMDITPMIDIVFLLLIFFIVAGQLDRQNPIDLPTARHGKGVDIKSSAIISVGLGTSEHANVFLADGMRDDARIESQDPDEQQEAIVEYLQQEIDRSSKSQVLIKAEKGVKYGEIARVSKAVAAVRDAAGNQLYFAVLEVE